MNVPEFVATLQPIMEQVATYVKEYGTIFVVCDGLVVAIYQLHRTKKSGVFKQQFEELYLPLYKLLRKMESYQNKNYFIYLIERLIENNIALCQPNLLAIYDIRNYGDNFCNLRKIVNGTYKSLKKRLGYPGKMLASDQMAHDLLLNIDHWIDIGFVWFQVSLASLAVLTLTSFGIDELNIAINDNVYFIINTLCPLIMLLLFFVSSIPTFILLIIKQIILFAEYYTSHKKVKSTRKPRSWRNKNPKIK
jgi:hypothetical protein